MTIFSVYFQEQWSYFLIQSSTQLKQSIINIKSNAGWTKESLDIHWIWGCHYCSVKWSCCYFPISMYLYYHYKHIIDNIGNRAPFITSTTRSSYLDHQKLQSKLDYSQAPSLGQFHEMQLHWIDITGDGDLLLHNSKCHHTVS